MNLLYSVVLTFSVLPMAEPLKPVCRDFDDKPEWSLDDDSSRYTTKLRVSGLKALQASSPPMMRYRNQVPALSVTSKQKGLVVRGYWPNGALRVRGEVDEQGQIAGTWRFHDPLGGTEWDVDFGAGESAKKIVKARSVHCAEATATLLGGATIELVCMRNGDRDGRYELRDVTGMVRDSGWYSAGEKDGLWFSRHPEGCRRSIMTYRGGVLHGPTVYWPYEEASVTEERERAGGHWAGSWGVGYRGLYENGKPSGVWSYWCAGTRYQAEYDPGDNPQLAITFDGCGPPASPTIAEGKKPGVDPVRWTLRSA